MFHEDVKMILNQIYGKAGREFIRRFFQYDKEPDD